MKRIAEQNAPLPLDSLILGALLFSGAEPPHIAGLASELEAHIQTVRALVVDVPSRTERGELILHYMHDELLTRYEELQTRVDVLLKNGRFNCVSSAVVFAILAQSCGLNVRGVNTADHALVSVEIDDGFVDVETTTRHGFDPGRRKEFFDEFGRITGYSYVPPARYTERSDLDAKGLLALILQNRISRLEALHRFAESVPLGVDRYTLHPTEETRRDMVLGFSNYAAFLNVRARYEEGSGFLELVGAVHGVFLELSPVRSILAYNGVIAVLNGGDYAGARQRVAKASMDRLIDAGAASELRETISQRELAALSSWLSPMQFLDRLEAMSEMGEVSERTYRRFAVTAYAREADQVSREVGFVAAMELLDRVQSVLGRDPVLARARDVYLHNFVADAHNEFARLANSGRMEDARDILLAALEQVPKSELLRRDLASLEQQRGDRR